MKKSCLLFIISLVTPLIHAQWTQKGADIDGESVGGDYSGYSVVLSSDGNVVAVGAYGNDGGAVDAGHVRVYDWNGIAWTQKGIDIDGEAANDRSGVSVSMSSDGNTVAIGARGNGDIAYSAGHVRIYQWSGTSWIQRGADIDGEAAQDQSGCSVSMSSDGNIVAIGASLNDGIGVDAGHVRIYEWSGASWTQKGADIDGEAAGDQSGYSVVLSSDGNTVAIGAPQNDGTATVAGHVRVYEWTGVWTQKGLDIDGEAFSDNSGMSVSMSSDGNTVAIGAPYNYETGAGRGHVRIYEWSGTTWTQKGIDIDGEADFDQSGISVSISSDGKIVAIGATRNAGSALWAGHVRIYEWSGTAWTQKGVDIDGEAEDDRSGISVSMSSDGNTLAIGAYLNDGTATWAGHARVYSFQLPVSIFENEFGNEVLLYPNPNDGTFSIDLGAKYESVMISVTDLTGKLVQSNIHFDSQVLNLKIEASAGVYFVIIESEDKKTSILLIKE